MIVYCAAVQFNWMNVVDFNFSIFDQKQQFWVCQCVIVIVVDYVFSLFSFFLWDIQLITFIYKYKKCEGKKKCPNLSFWIERKKNLIASSLRRTFFDNLELNETRARDFDESILFGYSRSQKSL